MNILLSIYIFKLKRSGPKALVVAPGHRPLGGVDFAETFAPVVKFISVLILLARAAAHNLKVHEMDVVTAICHGVIDTDV